MSHPVRSAITTHDLHQEFGRHGLTTRSMVVGQVAMLVIKGLR